MIKKNALFGLLLLFILFGCSPDLEELDKDTTSFLQDTSLNTYIEKVSYEIGEKNDGEYPVTIKVEAKEELSKLSEEELFYTLSNTVEYLHKQRLYLDCGNAECDYEKLEVNSGNDKYSMEFVFYNIQENLTLIINDNKEIVWDDIKKKDSLTTLELNVYIWMKDKYNEITNFGENYVPEIHDPQVAKLASEKFNISVEKAGEIYEKIEMKGIE